MNRPASHLRKLTSKSTKSNLPLSTPASRTEPVSYFSPQPDSGSPQSDNSYIAYAPAVCTPNGTLQRPRILTESISDPDLRDTESSLGKAPTRPRPGSRSRTTWTVRKMKDAMAFSQGVKGGDGALSAEKRSSGENARVARSPRRAHLPKTHGEEECVYVLTLKTSEEIAGPMNRMRDEWFPKELNRTPAHLTLFHALPHSKLESMETALEGLAAKIEPFPISTGKPFRMRRGVGVNLGAGFRPAQGLHDGLRDAWLEFLSEQDSGGWKPHWTVMNKESEEERVKEALDTVSRDLSRGGMHGTAVGIDLWRYDRGNWHFVKEYAFVGDRDGEDAMRQRDVGIATEGGREGLISRPDERKREKEKEKRPKSKNMWRSMSFGAGARTEYE